MQAVKCAWEREDGGDLRMGRSRAMQYHVGPSGNVWGHAVMCGAQQSFSIPGTATGCIACAAPAAE